MDEIETEFEVPDAQNPELMRSINDDICFLLKPPSTLLLNVKVYLHHYFNPSVRPCVCLSVRLSHFILLLS